MVLRYAVEGAACPVDTRPARQMGDSPLLFKEACPFVVVGQAILDAVVITIKVTNAARRIAVGVAVDSQDCLTASRSTFRGNFFRRLTDGIMRGCSNDESTMPT